jgi:hypothetical protein
VDRRHPRVDREALKVKLRIPSSIKGISRVNEKNEYSLIDEW